MEMDLKINHQPPQHRGSIRCGNKTRSLMEIEATFKRLVWDDFHFKAAFDVECANVSATVGSCAGISHPTFGAFPDTEYRDSCHNMRVHYMRVPAHIRRVCVFDVCDPPANSVQLACNLPTRTRPKQLSDISSLSVRILPLSPGGRFAVFDCVYFSPLPSRVLRFRFSPSRPGDVMGVR